jgi:hypothetical protein
VGPTSLANSCQDFPAIKHTKVVPLKQNYGRRNITKRYYRFAMIVALLSIFLFKRIQQKQQDCQQRQQQQEHWYHRER